MKEIALQAIAARRVLVSEEHVKEKERCLRFMGAMRLESRHILEYRRQYRLLRIAISRTLVGGFFIRTTLDLGFG